MSQKSDEYIKVLNDELQHAEHRLQSAVSLPQDECEEARQAIMRQISEIENNIQTELNKQKRRVKNERNI